MIENVGVDIDIPGGTMVVVSSRCVVILLMK